MSKKRSLNRTSNGSTGPGSVYARFLFLLREVEKRYPQSSSFKFSSRPPELALLESHDNSVDKLRSALNDAKIVLNDLLILECNDLSDPKMFKEARDRVDAKGSISYITETLMKITESLK